MKNLLKNKKLLVGLIILILVLGIIIALFLISREKEEVVLEQPVIQRSIGYSDQGIDLKNVSIDDSSYGIFDIAPSFKISKVEEWISGLEGDWEVTSSGEQDMYKWVNGDDYFLYLIDTNELIFRYSAGFTFNGSDINSKNFSDFIKVYIGEDWQYEVFTTEKISGDTIYYARRILENGKELEKWGHKQQTDHLTVIDGKIVSGKLLLLDLTLTNIKLPLIDSKDLNTYINLPEYPKEIYPKLEAIQDSIIQELGYLSEDLESVLSTLNNCEGFSSEIVYLYKHTEQEQLTPVYKLDLQCSLDYEGEQYFIPAVGYVNAIDPDYVTIPESE